MRQPIRQLCRIVINVLCALPYIAALLLAPIMALFEED